VLRGESARPRHDVHDAAPRREALDGGALEERRAARAGQALVGGIGDRRVHEARVGLEEAVVRVGQAPLRPAASDLRPVEALVRDLLLVHGGGVVGEGDRRFARGHVEAAGHGDDALAGRLLDLGPGRVGALREPNVVGPVVGEPQDPRMVLRGAAVVAELELLEAQDTVPEPGREPVRRRAADAAQPHDDRVPLRSHVLSVREPAARCPCACECDATRPRTRSSPQPHPYDARVTAPDPQLIAFVGVALAVVLLPGPDMALVARNVFRYGRAAGVVTSLGICTGVLGWALAAGLGVSALLATSSAAFTALKLAGAAYLIYLGISTLRAGDVPLSPGAGPSAEIPWRRAWVQGLVSALLNPKLGVFFLTLLPQFVGPGDAPAMRMVQLILVFDAIGLAWLVTWSLLLGAVGDVLDRPTPRRVIRLVTGTVLLGFGARVALDRS
jgi:threonine/homoserine/homoserine lactone efflux protein